MDPYLKKVITTAGNLPEFLSKLSQLDIVRLHEVHHINKAQEPRLLPDSISERNAKIECNMSLVLGTMALKVRIDS